MDELRLSPYQERVLAIPETVDVFLGGGRGGGKSFTLGLLALRHVEQYGERARVLYLRRTYKGCADFEGISRELFGAAYGTTARFNAAEHCWRFPSGAYVEISPLDDEGAYQKFQGRSFTLLLVDEAGQFPTPDLLDRLRSNLRGPKGVPVRMAMAANPGDAGHHWLAARFVFKAAPWVPFDEEKSGRAWVYAPSTYSENTAIDQEGYRRQLEASCPADPELLRAWVDGDWSIVRGAFFGQVLSEQRVAVEPWDVTTFAELRGAGRGVREGTRIVEFAMNPKDSPEASARGWETFLAHDFGSSAPSVTFACARSPGAPGPDGRWYPRDSIVLIDELATHVPGQLDRGLGWTTPKLAEAVRELAERWSMEPRGCADDAIFARTGSAGGSIAQEFAERGVWFEPAGKGDRRSGWERMRSMLEAAGKPDVPGLYVSRACEYFWATTPYLARDPRRVDDLDSRGPDHAADACRYALTWEPARLEVTPLARR